LVLNQGFLTVSVSNLWLCHLQCRPALEASAGRTGGFSQPHLNEVQLIAKVLCAPQQSNSLKINGIMVSHHMSPWFLMFLDI
jgi:hypothetical protein